MMQGLGVRSDLFRQTLLTTLWTRCYPDSNEVSWEKLRCCELCPARPWQLWEASHQRHWSKMSLVNFLDVWSTLQWLTRYSKISWHVMAMTALRHLNKRWLSQIISFKVNYQIIRLESFEYVQLISIEPWSLVQPITDDGLTLKDAGLLNSAVGFLDMHIMHWPNKKIWTSMSACQLIA